MVVNQVIQLTLFLYSFTLENFFGTFQETEAQIVTEITISKLTFNFFTDKGVTMNLHQL